MCPLTLCTFVQGGDGNSDRTSEVHPRHLALLRDGAGRKRERGRQRPTVGRETEEALHGHPRPEHEERAGEEQVRPVGRSGLPHLGLGGKKLRVPFRQIAIQNLPEMWTKPLGPKVD